MSAIVSDLVVQSQAAAAEAIVEHYHRFLTAVGTEFLDEIAHALDHGYDADLDERTRPDQPVGFDHVAISGVFRRRLRSVFGTKPALSHHIWGADEDQGLYSLFGRPAQPDAVLRGPRRSRASALVQRLIRDCRNYRQAEKATRAAEPARMVTVPSPLFVAKLLLGDPRSAGSQTYATAALQEWTREEIEAISGESIDLSFAGVSEALTLISNRWRTSKPIIADVRQNGATVIFLCNLLAIHGLAAMRVDIHFLAHALEGNLLSVDDQDESSPPFADRPEVKDFDRKLQGLWIGDRGAPCEFIINPQYAELPSAGEILNLIDSLPMPFEGAETVFQGGIRLSTDRSLVAAISGEFGTGKTLFGLSLAAALAPLGCRTLFLSCEESANDIQARLIEAAPRSLFRALPLFKTLDESDFQLKTFERLASEDEGGSLPWFQARQLQIHLEPGPDHSVDPASALADLLKEAVETAEIFRPWSEGHAGLPSFARPVIVIDGLHQLFDLPETYDLWDSSLRQLVDTCRGLGAVFLFSFSSDDANLRRMEYLCDLIIEVQRGGHANPAQKPNRVFQLLKARRQPARTGAHLFHIKGELGFRLKPSVDARLQELKSQRWWAPGDRGEIFLTDEPPTDFKRGRDSKSQTTNLQIANHSQVLVIGQGSSGKAGFGLYLLHRRWFDTQMIRDDRQMSLLKDWGGRSLSEMPARKKAIYEAGLPVRNEPAYLETRVLVISFLYQQSYYDELTNNLFRSIRSGRVDRKYSKYSNLDELGAFEYAPCPDRLRTDTIELYPGMLSVEDFIAKIDKKLIAAERSGVPYSGVLVDGLHNVFVQFPALENESPFWGMFYNILRRRRVTVVTTHTEFDITAHPDGQDNDSALRNAGPYDFEQAQRKIAPLLSALVSGADYLFDLSPSYEGGSLIYRLSLRAALGGVTGNRSYSWDKKGMRLEGLSTLNPESTSRRRAELARKLGDQFLNLIEAGLHDR